MRALIQRVSEASVTVEGAVVGEIGPGLLILICAMQGDTEAQADKLAAKIAKLRIFRDDEGRMNRSVLDTGGAALVISQFTLAADTQRGNRPAPNDPEVRAKLLELRERVRDFDAQNERADVSDFVDHIDHAVKIAGIDHVGISSDFDGGGGLRRACVSGSWPQHSMPRSHSRVSRRSRTKSAAILQEQDQSRSGGCGPSGPPVCTLPGG